MQLETLLDLVERMRIAQKTSQALGPKFNHPKLKELEEQVDAELARIRRQAPDELSETSSSDTSEPQTSDSAPAVPPKKGRGFERRRSQSDELATARWVPRIGDQVRYAAHHKVETEAALDSVGVITEIGAGPAGSRLIGINHCALRLESEVELITNAAEGNGRATDTRTTDKSAQTNVAAE